MCGKQPKAPPPVVQRDPVAEQKKLEAEAQTAANAESANRRRRRARAGAVQPGAMRATLLAGAGAQSRSLLAQATPEG